MPYYCLALDEGATTNDAGLGVRWAACPDLPGAYEEAADAAAAREAVRDLARRIIAEHLMRDDPLDPAIAVSDTAPDAATGVLVVAVTGADVAEARATPMLVIEQPEP